MSRRSENDWELGREGRVMSFSVTCTFVVDPSLAFGVDPLLAFGVDPLLAFGVHGGVGFLSNS